MIPRRGDRNEVHDMKAESHLCAEKMLQKRCIIATAKARS